MDSDVTITLGGREFNATRARLGLFLDLEIVLSRIETAAKKDDTGAIANAVLDYVSRCAPEITPELFFEASWYEVVNAYGKLLAMNRIKGDFAIITRQIGHSKPVPWDYPERVRVLWIHMLASAYHWGKESIENLIIEDAIGFIQEIEVDEQMQREFEHSLSEIAYHYDKASKKSKFVPLHKPAWMVLLKELPKTKLLKAYLPIGVIISMEDRLQSETKH